MPRQRTVLEEWQELEDKLHGQAVSLNREIADQLQQQSGAYERWIKPNAVQAKTLMAHTRSISKLKTISQKEATAIEAKAAEATPTELFEYGRFEVERISALVSARRTQLAKVQERLEDARRNVRRLRGEGLDLGGVAASQVAIPAYARERVDALRLSVRAWLGRGGSEVRA